MDIFEQIKRDRQLYDVTRRALQYVEGYEDCFDNMIDDDLVSPIAYFSSKIYGQPTEESLKEFVETLNREYREAKDKGITLFEEGMTGVFIFPIETYIPTPIYIINIGLYTRCNHDTLRHHSILYTERDERPDKVIFGKDWKNMIALSK